mgnify:CR=1 FL=1
MTPAVPRSLVCSGLLVSWVMKFADSIVKVRRLLACSRGQPRSLPACTGAVPACLPAAQRAPHVLHPI